mmetsp:Transcript_57018/g.144753  ORF Transcript_57018/g.144753 Transcript_57018/m.144753 type:complete len:1046 (-) Transcript_57018:337-3474(-)
MASASTANAPTIDPSEVSLEELERSVCTSIANGLSPERAAQVLAEDGPNELEKPPKPTLLMLFIMQLTGFVIVLLLCAAVASIVVNGYGPKKHDVLSYTTGMAIFIIVLINACIAAWTEHKAGDALEALTKMTQASIYVVRGGKEIKVEVPTIVRGDIVVLGTGDVVPADLRLAEADDVKVSEMALTGEPDDVAKTWKNKPRREGEPEKLTPENMVFSGCSVKNGKGKGIVVETGMHTRIGRIAQLIADADGGKSKKKCGCLPDTSANATPLQVNLERLGARIGVLAIIVCVVIFVIGVAMDRRDPSNLTGPSWLYMVLIAVTLAVAAIPEGIPLCVTISLSIGCSDMVKKNVLVRKLAAVETLGSASVICSDKTGTLTEGKMTMVKMYAGGVSYIVEGKGFDPEVGRILHADTQAEAGSDMAVKSSLLAALLCCDTTLSKVTDKDTKEERWEPKGNSSEAPIVVAARKVGLSETVVSKEYARVLEVPFSSSRKMMLTVSDVSCRSELCPGGMPLEDGSKYFTVCKGAPNFILDYCSEQLMEDGSVQEMTKDSKDKVLSIVDEYSSMALRVLAIATRSMPKLPFDVDDEEVTTDQKFKACRSGLRLVGLVASIDPDRDGVPESVELARGAGIRVIMITGDYLKTAIAIAHNVKILQKEDDEAAAVDCGKLRPNDEYLSHTDMDALTSSVRVFARARPEDKLEIVKSLQRQGLVTAMTGDGVNDAPALNQANIGVAMGIQGTEVAKGASDMILTDDNFCSIVSAVEKGRTIYAGIQKFVAFIMSVHIAEVLQIFVCIVAGIPVMRTPLQILFLILVTDLPPSIALGMEPGEKTILEEKPRPKSEPVVLGWMWCSMMLNGTILASVIIGVYIVALTYYCDGEVLQANIDTFEDSEDRLMKARTVAFVSLVWSENIRSYTSRSFDKPVWRNMFGNKDMQKAIVLAQLCLYAAVFIPRFSDTILKLSGASIGLHGWLLALAGPAGCLIFCEACKVITVFQMKNYQRSLAAKHKVGDAVEGGKPGVPSADQKEAKCNHIEERTGQNEVSI